jgi:hypothetical protein
LHDENFLPQLKICSRFLDKNCQSLLQTFCRQLEIPYTTLQTFYNVRQNNLSEKITVELDGFAMNRTFVPQFNSNALTLRGLFQKNNLCLNFVLCSQQTLEIMDNFIKDTTIFIQALSKEHRGLVVFT